MEIKLFYLISDGESSIMVKPSEVENILNFGLTEHDKNTPTEDLPVFTVSPVYMTQEEYDAMPEFEG